MVKTYYPVSLSKASHSFATLEPEYYVKFWTSANLGFTIRGIFYHAGDIYIVNNSGNFYKVSVDSNGNISWTLDFSIPSPSGASYRWASTESVKGSTLYAATTRELLAIDLSTKTLKYYANYSIAGNKSIRGIVIDKVNPDFVYVSDYTDSVIFKAIDDGTGLTWDTATYNRRLAITTPSESVEGFLGFRATNLVEYVSSSMTLVSSIPRQHRGIPFVFYLERLENEENIYLTYNPIGQWAIVKISTVDSVVNYLADWGYEPYGLYGFISTAMFPAYNPEQRFLWLSLGTNLYVYDFTHHYLNYEIAEPYSVNAFYAQCVQEDHVEGIVIDGNFVSGNLYTLENGFNIGSVKVRLRKLTSKGVLSRPVYLLGFEEPLKLDGKYFTEPSINDEIVMIVPYGQPVFLPYYVGLEIYKLDLTSCSQVRITSNIQHCPSTGYSIITNLERGLYKVILFSESSNKLKKIKLRIV